MTVYNVLGRGSQSTDRASLTRMKTDMATTYFAVLPEVYRDMQGESRPDDVQAPALLMSYYYLDKTWPACAHEMWYRSWCLDSGGFTAFTQGVEIKLDDYIARARELLAADPTLDFVFTLDDIRSWRNTKANTERMWAGGVPAVPVYHVGEPESVLRGYARDYPKVALGGMIPLQLREKTKFAEQCFNRVWPCAIHGLGVGGRTMLMKLPWHSADSSNWSAPARYGKWHAHGGAWLRGAKVNNLRTEIEHYLKLEREVEFRWRETLAPVRETLRQAGWRRP